MKVSVVLVTYNHARFIAQAIESALAQRVSFDYEVVIGDDCSTDGTRELVQEYGRRYPERVRALLHERRLGIAGNPLATFRACRGQYIAYLDGDDYWTSPEKLQRQVDLLDAHPEYTACYHNALVIYEGDALAPHAFLDERHRTELDLTRLLDGNFIASASVMYRAGAVPGIPDWVRDLPFTDWTYHLLHAQRGPIGYVDEIMSARRIHAGGAWCGLDDREQARSLVTMFEVLGPRLDAEHAPAIAAKLAAHYWHLAGAHLAAGERDLARQAATAALTRGAGQPDSTLESILDGLEASLQALRTQLAEGEQSVRTAQATVAVRDEAIGQLRAELAGRDEAIGRLEAAVSGHQEQVGRLQAELASIRASRFWPLVRLSGRVRQWLDRGRAARPASA